ncbi:MAG: mismatch-specific DNA-glycosylase [Elusimicrobia bacterium]|nr:mismatch-specific DNA-glycosylase [Elusimicrobiota bacterium]
MPDVIGPGLRILLVGINPGLYSGAVKHHFARPGNRFWPALYAGGLTPRLFSPFDEPELLHLGIGITNLVRRATAGSAELSEAELRRGAETLERKVRRYGPRIVAVFGVEAYRAAFSRPRPPMGRQPERIAGSILWLLPNPSGLNAHYQPAALARLVGELRRAAAAPGRTA